MADKAKPKDVDAYIAGSAKEAQPILREMRRIVKETIPDVEETISWGVPIYKHHGQLGGFAAYKNHVSFGCDALEAQSEVRKTLEADGYKLGKETLQVRFDQGVPAAAIERVLRAKVKLNKARR
jgi:uncharacterized protein